MKIASSNWLLGGLLALVSLAATAPGQEKTLPPRKEALIIDVEGFGMPRAALSPDGRSIVTSQYAGVAPADVNLYDATNGKPLLTIPKAHNSRYSVAVGFSPDGKRVVSTGDDGLVKVWDARTGKQLLTLKGHSQDDVRSVAWSPDGKRIVSGCGREAKVWDVETGKEVFSLSHNGKSVRDVAFSPDGKRIATSGSNRAVMVWDAGTGKELLTFTGNPGNAGIAFSPDSKLIVSASGNNIKDEAIALDRCWIVKVWEVETGKEKLTIEGPKGKGQLLRCAAFSPDGKWIVAGGSVWADIHNVMLGNLGLVKVWEVATGREVLTHMPVARHMTHSTAVSVAFSPDGRRLIAGCYGSSVHVWALETPDVKR